MSTYRPFLKDNNKIIYINTESDLPPSVIKQLPKSIELRLSQLLGNEEILYSRTQSGYKGKQGINKSRY